MERDAAGVARAAQQTYVVRLKPGQQLVMAGHRVYTTLVIAVQEHPHSSYRREFDSQSGYDELAIERR